MNNKNGSRKSRKESSKQSKFIFTVFALPAFLLASLAEAAPMYVGENLSKQDMIILNIFDVPTKSTVLRDDGNILALKIQVQKTWNETFGWSATIPAYTASAGATGTSGDTNIGDMSVSFGASKRLSDLHSPDFGGVVNVPIYLPTARKSQAGAVSVANPTTDYFQYAPFSTATNPQVGAYFISDFWSAKATIGYGYQYISKESLATASQHRNHINWQTALSAHPISILDLNAEYNAIYLDSSATLSKSDRLRHALSPSATLRIKPVAVGLYVTIPFDSPTREISEVTLGAKAGFVF